MKIRVHAARLSLMLILPGMFLWSAAGLPTLSFGGDSFASGQVINVASGGEFKPGNLQDDPESLYPVSGQAVQHDLSPALRNIPLEALQALDNEEGYAALPLPKAFERASLSSPEPQTMDPVLQNSLGTGAMPQPINNFEGVGNQNLVLPPDTQGDIGFDPATGRKYYVQWVNLSFAIWDVTAAPTRIYGPVSGNTLWHGFGGPCETTNHGDPITLYDPLAQRWLMSQFSVDGPFYQCIAISQTGDPTGAWFRYAFLISNTKMNDYPHFGVWSDGYYMTINQFNLDNSWGGSGVVVFNRAKMLAGQQAGFQYFDLYSVNSNFGGMLPADLDGLNPPPAGAPNYFLEVDDASWIGPQDALRLWRFHVDWSNPANTTFGIAGQPNATLPSADWMPLCEGVSACIPQPGTSSRLDAIADRLMFRLAYRNFGDHEALVVNHTVNTGSGQAGVRWYEVRDPGGVPVLFQQGTYAPDLNNRWMGSIAQDRMGNIALGYSVSSSTVFPSVRYTGRLAEDPTGLMTQDEAVLVSGGGSQTHASSRWGDYSMLSVDPVDDCTFWYTQEYYATTSSSDWKTRIGSFRFPGCSDATPGKISGLVTEASNGDPVPGATLKATSSPGTVYQTISGADGRYNLLLAAGTYDLGASAYGYFSQAMPDVQVEAGITTTLNFDLKPTEKYLVSGSVKDNLTGWPLYARISISGYPGDPPTPYNQVWTDPLTGHFTATLAAGSDYHLQVDSFSSGYLSASYQTGILTGNQTHDFMLEVDQETCSAPGYTRHSDGFQQSFDAAEKPTGWSVVDNAGTGAAWRFDNPKPRPNYTGGSGNFAIIDSDFEGPVNVDTELLTPRFDLSSYPTATLEFKYDFNWYEYGQDEQAAVDLSVDGGSTWSNVWQRFGAGDRGPKTARVDISSLAGSEPDVRLRFHYYQANFEWWWQVDDFFIGRQSCEPDPGGLVVGEVSDANISAPLPGAVVHSDSGESTLAAISQDPHMTGAFYTLYSPQGSHTFTSTAGTQYGSVVNSVQVVPGEATRLDFSLPAGWIHAEPPSLDITLKAGLTSTQVITLSNDGGLGANFQVSEVNAPLSPSDAVGPFAAAERRVSPAYLDDTDARSVRIYVPPDVPALDAGSLVRSWDSGLNGAWGVAYDTSRGNLWLSDVASLKGDGWDHRFLLDGSSTGERIDTMAWAGAFAADMAYDPLRDRLWQVAVGGDQCIYALDPHTLFSTGRKLCPAFGVSMRGLAYDPLTDTFYSGSWNDQILYHFDSRGKLLDSADVRLNISGLAFNPATGHLFALSNAGIGFDVYLLNTTNGYSPLGGFDIPGLGAFEQAGLALDCSGNLWAANQSSGQVIEARSGETGVCTQSEIPWLSVSPLSGGLSPSERQPLSLDFDAQTISPGVYPAYLRVSSDTPYGTLDLPVTMTVRLDYDFILMPESAEKTASPGEQITFTLQVENTGLRTDEYKVEIGDSQWSAQAASTLGPLVPGEIASLPVTVMVPADVGCNAMDDFSVVLTSRNDPARGAVASLKASVSLICGVDMQPADSTIVSTVGEEVIHTLQLTNTGNISDTFNLTIDNNSLGWSVSITPNTPTELTLAASASLDLFVHVLIPPDAVAGQSEHVSIRATSSGDDSQYVISELTTEVRDYQYYLPYMPNQ